MSSIKVIGGGRLKGEIKIQGSKMQHYRLLLLQF